MYKKCIKSPEATSCIPLPQDHDARKCCERPFGGVPNFWSHQQQQRYKQ